jgi:hypothetical protein
MKYFISGSTSGLGNIVVDLLCKKISSSDITCLVRSDTGIGTENLRNLGVRLHIGDVTKAESFESQLDSKIIYIDMTHPKFYGHSLNTVIKMRVERAFFVTTTGIFSKYNSASEIYVKNEQSIINSKITYTILRPSMIYGHLRDRNMSKLIQFLCRYPIFPLFNDGKSMMTPVFVDDLAFGIAQSVLNVDSENKAYNLCGPSPISYRVLVETILTHLSRNNFLLNIPLPIAIFGAKIGSLFPNFPITYEQVLRLQEDKVFDISSAIQDLGFSPRSFDEGIGIEIQLMKNAGLIPT